MIHRGPLQHLLFPEMYFILFLAILTSTAIKKPKLSSWETTNSFSDTYYEPRKHFDSEGKEEKIQTGKAWLAVKVKYLNAFSFFSFDDDCNHRQVEA